MLEHRLREDKAHGDSTFPFSIYPVNYLQGNQQILPCHWHDEYEIIHVHRGSAIFKIDDSPITVETGQSLIISGGKLHSAYSHDHKGCQYTAIVFKLAFLNSGTLDTCQEAYLNPILFKRLGISPHIKDETANEKQLHAWILQIIEAFTQQTIGYPMMIKGYLYLILGLLFQNDQIISRTEDNLTIRHNKQKQLKEVLTHIEENYMSPIYIDDLAALIPLSRSHFCRFFKDYTGLSPMNYLNMYRINHAANFLQSSNCSVIDAALLTGFDNLSHFTNTFKKYKQCTPLKYKQNYLS